MAAKQLGVTAAAPTAKEEDHAEQENAEPGGQMRTDRKQADGGQHNGGKKRHEQNEGNSVRNGHGEEIHGRGKRQATRQQQEQDQVEHGGQSLRNVACAGGATAVGLAPGERRSKPAGGNEQSRLHLGKRLQRRRRTAERH